MKSNIFLMGIMRGGSSIVAETVERLCRAAGIDYADPATPLYYQNKSIHDVDWKQEFEEAEGGGRVFGMFRELPNWVVNLNMSAFRKILIIRDPRDCLVSLFHVRKFHSRNDASADRYHIPTLLDIDDIDQFCVANMKYFRDRFNAYMNFCRERPDVLLYKYEDIADSFPQFVDDCVRYLEVTEDHPRYSDVFAEATVIKTTTVLRRSSISKGTHYRSGQALQYLQELRGETLEELAKQFSGPIDFFGYGGKPVLLGSSDGSAEKSIDPKVESMIESLLNYNKILAHQNGLRIQEIQLLQEKLDGLERQLSHRQGEQDAQKDK